MVLPVICTVFGAYIHRLLPLDKLMLPALSSLRANATPSAFLV